MTNTFRVKKRTENREKLAYFKRMKNKQIDGEKINVKNVIQKKIKTNKLMKTKSVIFLDYMSYFFNF